MPVRGDSPVPPQSREACWAAGLEAVRSEARSMNAVGLMICVEPIDPSTYISEAS